MLKSEKYPQSWIQANNTQLNDTDEGGLNLGQIGATLRRRALLIAGVTGVVAAGATFRAKNDPPVYVGQFDILTKPVTGEAKVVANVPQTLTAQNPENIAAPETVDQVKTTIKVLQSPRLLNDVVKKQQAKYPDLTYKDLAGGLDIKSTQPNVLEVKYTNADEQQVRDISKALSEAYLQYSLNERKEDVEQAVKFVNKQIEDGNLRQRVDQWQNKLRNLRQKFDFIEPAQKAQQLSTQIGSLTQQRMEARVEYDQMVTKYSDLQRELAQQSTERAGNSLLSDNPRYQKVLDQIQQIEADIKKETRFTEDHPTMKGLRDKQTRLESMLKNEEERVLRDFKSRINAVVARDQSLDKKINDSNVQLRQLAGLSRDYDKIQLELKIATENLGQFITKEQALKIELSQKVQPWKLLDPELSEVKEPTPVSESGKLNLVLGGLFGLLLGTGAALVVDKLSNIFYSAKDIKDTTLLPMLGTIPLRKELAVSALQDNDSGQIKKPDRTAFFEVFRSLYTNILLLGSDTPIRSLVVSSAAPGDGKSTIAIYLALAAAAMGHRVLLVDANLRCPTLHKRVGIMNIQGLTDIISSDLDWSNVIERSPIEDNLYVLSGGPIPPDSIRLLASQKMQDLMNDLQASFDFVIYDTPSIVGFADANLLAANTNGMVLVAGLGKVKRTVFQQALEELQVSGTPVLGVVANKSKEATPASYSYYEEYYKKSMSAEKIEIDEEVKQASSSSTIRKVRGK